MLVSWEGSKLRAKRSEPGSATLRHNVAEVSVEMRWEVAV